MTLFVAVFHYSLIWGHSTIFTALVTTFNVEIGITGAILTKLDGDSRGGAALSVKEVCLGIAYYGHITLVTCVYAYSII